MAHWPDSAAIRSSGRYDAPPPVFYADDGDPRQWQGPSDPSQYFALAPGFRRFRTGSFRQSRRPSRRPAFRRLLPPSLFLAVTVQLLLWYTMLSLAASSISAVGPAWPSTTTKMCSALHAEYKHGLFPPVPVQSAHDTILHGDPENLTAGL